jgi:ATP-dependent Clp protease protease subunit
MCFVKAPVYTYAIGEAASMGAFLLSAGEKGHRYATRNATIMTHRVSSGTKGNIQDQIVALEYSKALDARLANILAANCGMTVEDYLAKNVRDNFMFPEAAKEFGIIDEII